MHEEERNLDQHVENMRKSMRVLLEDPAHKGNLYIAEDDIKEIPCFASETLVAVRAPHGTTLEVPDPDEEGEGRSEKRYQIFLRSSSGPVEVFLVSLHDDLEERPVTATKTAANDDARARNAVPGGLDFESSPPSEAPESDWDSNRLVARLGAAPSPKLDFVDDDSSERKNDSHHSSRVTRILPPSCDPDYWFSEDAEAFGLREMFVQGGTGDYAFDHPPGLGDL